MNRELTFQGTHTEVGEQIGEQYKQWGRTDFRIYPDAEEHYTNQKAYYELYFPELMHTFEGISHAFGVNDDRVFRAFLTDFLTVANGAAVDTTERCSTVAVKNNNGVQVGANYDWRKQAEKSGRLVHHTYNENNHITQTTGLSDMGVWRIGETTPTSKHEILLENAWNPHGLYIGLHGAPGRHGNSGGMSAPHLVQLIAERCTTTEEAVSVLQEIKTPTPNIYVVADRSGAFSILEKTADNRNEVIQGLDILIATNHFQSQNLIRENALLPYPHSTWARFPYLNFVITKDAPALTVDTIKDKLAVYPVLQNWPEPHNGDVVTVWSNSLNLTNNEYDITFSPLQSPERVTNR